MHESLSGGRRISRIGHPFFGHLVGDWLHDGEKLAKLDAQRGSRWHAYGRSWGTRRNHLPDQDVAAAGGWKDPNTLRTVYQQADSEYQQADTETPLRVVTEGAELREATGK